jgi:hypothetical protein
MTMDVIWWQYLTSRNKALWSRREQKIKWWQYLTSRNKALWFRREQKIKWWQYLTSRNKALWSRREQKIKWWQYLTSRNKALWFRQEQKIKWWILSSYYIHRHLLHLSDFHISIFFSEHMYSKLGRNGTWWFSALFVNLFHLEIEYGCLDNYIFWLAQI